MDYMKIYYHNYLLTMETTSVNGYRGRNLIVYKWGDYGVYFI